MSDIPERLVIPREGEADAWVQFRPKSKRFTGGERKSIYKFLDGAEMTSVYTQYEMLRRIACHVLHSWSYDFPVPRPVIEKGAVVGYEHTESLDMIDDDVESFVLQYANEWGAKLALNFQPNPDQGSPTKPSDGSKPASEVPAG